MKAAVVVANEDVQYQEVEEPKVTKGTVKIKVRYVSDILVSVVLTFLVFSITEFIFIQLFWDMNFPVMW